MIPNHNPMPDRNASTRTPWAWVPTVYFAEGLPYVIVTVVSAILYKNLGLSNTQATFYTSWLYLPWVIKPLWSPLVENSAHAAGGSGRCRFSAAREWRASR